MKKTILSILILLLHVGSFSQILNTIGGAQGSAMGVTDCYPYMSPCSDEYDAEILLVINTDSDGEETSWKIENISDGTVVASGDNPVSDSTYQQMVCAKTDNCYRLIINDSGANGINTADSKGYKVYWNGILKNQGGSFAESDTTSLGACCNDFSVKLVGGIPCINYTKGQVQVETSGGIPPFEYLWSNGATHSEKQNVSSSDDKISVTVTDASNCTASDTFFTSELKSLEIDVLSKSGGYCNTNSGEASVNVLCGIPPFKYTWSNGGDSQMEHNLAPGTYHVKVTDASNCVAEKTVNINTSYPLSISIDSNEGGNIAISVTGGSPPYYFEWYNTDDLNTILSSSEEISGLSVGTYQVDVTDANGCSESNTIVKTTIKEKNLNEDLITLFPNPTNGQVRIEMNFSQPRNVQISLLDILGKTLIEKKPIVIINHSVEFDLSNYISGIYYFRLNIDGQCTTKPIIIRK